MLFLVILLFKMPPNHSVEGLSSVPKHKKAVMCFTEKIHVLDKLFQVLVVLPLGVSSVLNQ